MTSRLALVRFGDDFFGGGLRVFFHCIGLQSCGQYHLAISMSETWMPRYLLLFSSTL